MSTPTHLPMGNPMPESTLSPCQGLWIWTVIIIQRLLLQKRPRKYFQRRELNPGLLGESQLSLPLDHVGCLLFKLSPRFEKYFLAKLSKCKCAMNPGPYGPSPFLQTGLWCLGIKELREGNLSILHLLPYCKQYKQTVSPSVLKETVSRDGVKFLYDHGISWL